MNIFVLNLLPATENDAFLSVRVRIMVRAEFVFRVI